MENTIGISADGLVKVLELNEEDETVKVQFRNDKPEWCAVSTGPDGDNCFKVGELVYSFSEILRA